MYVLSCNPSGEGVSRPCPLHTLNGWSWTALPLSATTPWVNKGTVDHGLLTKPGWPCTLHTLFQGDGTQLFIFHATLP